MVTGYEIQMYRDIERMRKALEEIADVLKALNTVVAYMVEQQGLRPNLPSE